MQMSFRFVGISQRYPYRATAHSARRADTMRSMGGAIHRPAWLALQGAHQGLEGRNRFCPQRQSAEKRADGGQGRIIQGEQSRLRRQLPHQGTACAHGFLLFRLTLGLDLGELAALRVQSGFGADFRVR